MQFKAGQFTIYKSRTYVVLAAVQLKTMKGWVRAYTYAEDGPASDGTVYCRDAWDFENRFRLLAEVSRGEVIS